jgi:hypothetical protein
VLFLTTNRIKTFDDAFLSRFSICMQRPPAFSSGVTHSVMIGIKYPELDQVGRYTVWRKFFELAGCRVGSSEDDFDTLEDESTTISPDDVRELATKPFNGTPRGLHTCNNGMLSHIYRTDHQKPRPDRAGPCAVIVRRYPASTYGLIDRAHRSEPLRIRHVQTVVRVQEKFLTDFATN